MESLIEELHKAVTMLRAELLKWLDEIPKDEWTTEETDAIEYANSVLKL